MILRHSLPAFVLILFTTFTAPSTAANDLGERLQACAACHGEKGRSSSEAYYPSIAGKPSGYLFRQLENFQTGRRPHAIMRNMLAYLSDDYLQDIARYYAKQPAAVITSKPEASNEQLKLGKQLVILGNDKRGLPACTTCHANALQGIRPDIPGLTGLRAEYLSAQLGAWQVGTRSAPQPDCMAEIAKKLSGDEIQAIALYIANQDYAGKPLRGASLPPALPISCGAVQ